MSQVIVLALITGFCAGLMVGSAGMYILMLLLRD
jgi:hypothetical protein